MQDSLRNDMIVSLMLPFPEASTTHAALTLPGTNPLIDVVARIFRKERLFQAGMRAVAQVITVFRSTTEPPPPSARKAVTGPGGLRPRKQVRFSQNKARRFEGDAECASKCKGRVSDFAFQIWARVPGTQARPDRH